MKTEQDLTLLYKADFGDYPQHDDEYIKWLEEKLIYFMNQDNQHKNQRLDETSCGLPK